MEERTLYIASEWYGWTWGKPLIAELLRIALPEYRIVVDREKCQLAIRSMFSDVEPEVPGLVPYITWSGESIPSPPRSTHAATVDVRSHGDTDFASGVLNIPFLVVVYAQYLRAGQLPYNRQGGARPFFLAYCHSSPIAEREQFFAVARLLAGERAHGLGRCSNTTGGQRIPGTCSAPELLATYTQYTFVMAMENRQCHGYITEKLLNAFYGGAIPVYWGDDALARSVFNDKAFICVNDYPSMEACIKDMIAIEADAERLSAMQQEPIFKNNVVPPLLSLCSEDLGPYYREVASRIRHNVLQAIGEESDQQPPTHTISLQTL